MILFLKSIGLTLIILLGICLSFYLFFIAMLNPDKFMIFVGILSILRIFFTVYGYLKNKE